MFGALLRAAPEALFIALFAAIVARVVDPLKQAALDGPATQSDTLIVTLSAATENFILVGLLALLLTLIARATIESQLAR